MKSPSGNESVAVYRYDWTEVSPPIAVVESLAEETDKSAEQLDPLYNSLDPDALKMLLSDEKAGEDVRVTFTFASYGISLDGAGTVAITEPTDSGSSHGDA